MAGCVVAERIDIAQIVSLNDSPLGCPIYSFSQSPTSIAVLAESQDLHLRDPSLTPFIPGHAPQACQIHAGHLSLHDYRKYLSQPDDTVIPDVLRGRTLKRKTGAMNLSQAPGCRDLSLSLSSYVSSAPSSPPPLSFSQSAISYRSDEDLDSPVNPSHGAPSVIPSPLLSQRQQPDDPPKGAAWHNQNTETFVSVPRLSFTRQPRPYLFPS
jgi:hypothetical protein